MCQWKKARTNQAKVCTEQRQNSKSPWGIWAQNKKKLTGNKYYLMLLFPSLSRNNTIQNKLYELSQTILASGLLLLLIRERGDDTII